jgi:hypothetical protein
MALHMCSSHMLPPLLYPLRFPVNHPGSERPELLERSQVKHQVSVCPTTHNLSLFISTFVQA